MQVGQKQKRREPQLRYEPKSDKVQNPFIQGKLNLVWQAHSFSQKKQMVEKKFQAFWQNKKGSHKKLQKKNL